MAQSFASAHRSIQRYTVGFSRLIGEPVKKWVGGISMLALISALVVLLAGTIAERKEWQAAQKMDDSQ
jgi:hypothetical protein